MGEPITKERLRAELKRLKYWQPELVSPHEVALLQWALAKIEECEQLAADQALAIDAEQRARERERRLHEALAAILSLVSSPASDNRDALAGALRQSAALLAELEGKP